MTAAEMQTSHPVELEVHINGKKTTLLTEIEKIINQTVLLTPIQLNGKVVGFPPDCRVHLLYIEDNHVYCFKNIQLKAIRYENKVYHCATLIGDAEILNRRGAFRVYIGTDSILTAFTARGPKSHRVLLKDLSESGMAYLSSEDFDIGRTVRMNIIIAPGKEMKLGAQIIRIQEFEDRQEKLYGCKFLEKNNLLTGYLMRCQQERQRQRLGF